MLTDRIGGMDQSPFCRWQKRVISAHALLGVDFFPFL